jgi:hypothetical protein
LEPALLKGLAGVWIICVYVHSVNYFYCACLYVKSNKQWYTLNRIGLVFAINIYFLFFFYRFSFLFFVYFQPLNKYVNDYLHFLIKNQSNISMLSTSSEGFWLNHLVNFDDSISYILY